MRKCKLKEHILSTILLNTHHHNINNHSILSCNTNKIGIQNNNNTLNKGGVEIFEVDDDNKEEENLVEEEAKSYVITVGNQEMFLKISKVLEKHAHIVKNLITMLNSVHK